MDQAGTRRPDAGHPGLAALVVLIAMVLALVWTAQRFSLLESSARVLAGPGEVLLGSAGPFVPQIPAVPVPPPDAVAPPPEAVVPPEAPLVPPEEEPEPAPPVLVSLVDDGATIKANSVATVVPEGAAVEVSLAATMECLLGAPGATLETFIKVLEGDLQLAAGETVLIRNGEFDGGFGLHCENTVPDGSGASAVVHVTVVDSLETSETPIDVTLQFDGTNIKAQPGAVEIAPGSELRVSFAVVETCDLASVPAEAIFAGGDATLEVGTSVLLEVESGQEFELRCENLDRAESFVVRGQ